MSNLVSPSNVWPTLRPAVLWPLTTLCALTGAMLWVAAYQSLEPLAVAGLAGLAGALITLWAADRRASLTTYCLLFAVGLLMAGIGGVYAEILRDTLQLESDAGAFYKLARSDSAGLSIDEIVILTEGVGAVLAWRWVYDTLAAIGLEKGRYIGVAVNVVFVALSGVIASRSCQLLYPGDVARLRRMRLMLAACGLLWLYSSIHLRDASILLLVTVTFHLWLRQLLRPGAASLFNASWQTLLLCLALGLLRQEFALVPLIIASMAQGARVMFAPGAKGSPGVRWLVLMLALAAGAGLLLAIVDDLGVAFSRGAEVYGEQVAREAAAGSLGNALIVQQPYPLRAVLGLAYLMLYPIPLWSGLQLDSVATLMKSFNAVFFYFFAPLLVLAAGHTLVRSGPHRFIDVFMLAIVLLFGVGIALTSLESRHFGAFIVPAFCLALRPDLRAGKDRRQYHDVLIVLLSLLGAVHLAWAVLKLA